MEPNSDELLNLIARVRQRPNQPAGSTTPTEVDLLGKVVELASAGDADARQVMLALALRDEPVARARLHVVAARCGIDGADPVVAEALEAGDLAVGRLLAAAYEGLTQEGAVLKALTGKDPEAIRAAMKGVAFK